MVWESESARSWAATILAAATLVVAGWWKGRLIVRRDNRVDRGEQQAHDGQAQVIAQLRAEVARLAAQIDAMSARLDSETRRRYAAEVKAAELQLRVSALEAELAEIRGDPT